MLVVLDLIAGVAGLIWDALGRGVQGLDFTRVGSSGSGVLSLISGHLW